MNWTLLKPALSFTNYPSLFILTYFFLFVFKAKLQLTYLLHFCSKIKCNINFIDCTCYICGADKLNIAALYYGGSIPFLDVLRLECSLSGH